MSIYEPQVWRAGLGVITPRVPSAWPEVTLGVRGSVEPTINLESLDPRSRWRIVCASGVFSGVADNVNRWGWNVAGAGGRENASDHAIYVQLESTYFNGAFSLAEWIIGWISDDGTVARRPIQSGVRLDTAECSTSVEGGFAIFDSARAQPARVTVIDTPAAVTRAVLINTIPTVEPNNTAALTQLNPAGNAYTEIARVNASGYVQLAGAGGITQTNGAFIIRASTGQAWTDATGMRGLLIQEATSTRWNLAPIGSTTTLESGASITITGGRELAYSASSGQTPDVSTGRINTATTTGVATTVLTLAMPANSTVLFEIDAVCRSANGVQWGSFKRMCFGMRIGSAVPVFSTALSPYVARSSGLIEINFVSGGAANTAIVQFTQGAELLPMTWIATIKRTVQL